MARVKKSKDGESRLRTDKGRLKIGKLKPYMINTGILTGVTLVNIPKKTIGLKPYTEDDESLEEYLQLNNSWLQLSLIMLSVVYQVCDGNQGEFEDTLIKDKITSHGFKINTQVIKYIGEGKTIFAYKIPGTELILETDLDYNSIYKAIKGLAKIIENQNSQEILMDIQAKGGD